MDEKSWSMIATGQKNGEQVEVVCQEGIFTEYPDKKSLRELLSYQLSADAVSATSYPGPLEPLRIEWTIYRFFDDHKSVDLVYRGIEKPVLEYDPDAIY